MKLKRPLYGPQDQRGPSHGRDVVAVKRGLWKVEDEFFPRPPPGFDDVYNAKTEKAVSVFQRISDLPDTGIFNQPTLDSLAPYMDAYAKLMYVSYVPLKPKPKVPDLGPVVIGGPTLLNSRLTHPTSGIPHYPALDAGWIIGLDSIAVEDMVVTRASSANIGDACFTRGVSGIDYWYGHLVACPPVGTRLRKGAKVGDIAVHPNGAHVHFGMDARSLTGNKDLVYGYGIDVPTVGEQLAKERQ